MGPLPWITRNTQGLTDLIVWMVVLAAHCGWCLRFLIGYRYLIRWQILTSDQKIKRKRNKTRHCLDGNGIGALLTVKPCICFIHAIKRGSPETSLQT